MTPAQAVEAVSEHVRASWAGSTFNLPISGAAVPPIVFGNEAYAPPTDGSAYLRASVRDGTTKARTMGATRRKYQTDAAMQLMLAAPVDSGDQAMAALLGIVRGFMEGKNLTVPAAEEGGRSLWIRSGKTIRSGTDGRFSYRLVEFPFSYTERK